jgi:hypothetical protein
MTDERIVWLRQQIVDDIRMTERVLRFSRDSYARADPEAWVAERQVNNEHPPYYDRWVVRTERPGTIQREILHLPLDLGGLNVQHIARFGSPRRLLRDLRARFEMLDDIVAVSAFRREPLLRAAAAPYVDRPGCPDEWLDERSPR